MNTEFEAHRSDFPGFPEGPFEILAFPAGRYSDQVDAFSQALHRAFDWRGGFFWGPVRGLS
jgi:hypothetical protein